VSGDCLKLTTYFGERDRTGERLLGDALLDLYGERGVPASILLRGAAGFGAGGRRHTDELLSLSEDLPVVTVAVDRRERIEAIVPAVLERQRRGLITLERARLLDGGETEPDLAETVKVTVYLGRQARVGGRPAFVEACARLHDAGIAGATVLLGVDGTSRGRRTRARFLGRNADVPVMVIAVGDAEPITATLAPLRAALGDPPATLERVRVCKRDGRLLAPPHELPRADERGRPLWQKLTVYSSQSATHDGRPLAGEIVRRLRDAGAAGATSLRGVWGFHGDHPPHGDRFLQLRRHVPVVTIAVDAPERIGRAFAEIDEVTGVRGLVTSELVPTLIAPDERGCF
jgi:PII-like signaling protein